MSTYPSAKPVFEGEGDASLTAPHVPEGFALAGALPDSAIVVPTGSMANTVDTFIQRYGFRVSRVFPADDPQSIEMVGWGLRLVFVAGADASGIVLRLPAAAAPQMGLAAEQAPNGVRLEWGEPAVPDIWQPIAAEARHIEAAADDSWHVGRAGLRYRDLLPDRLGGGIIASQIRLLHGGPVPDYVHYHRVTFQMIYCRSGWVEVVYEDQGSPFLMREGDCVLQPPGIRHRVLASSAGAEVVELACPASHETFGDLGMALPNAEVRRGLEYGGQEFVWHRADEATTKDGGAMGWRWRDFDFMHATRGLAEAGVCTVVPGAASWEPDIAGVFRFLFVLSGQIVLAQHESLTLTVGEGAVLMPDVTARLEASATAEAKLLYVRLLRQPNVQPPVIEERPR
ncbi:MAG: cupin domain-containing protein [Pigmentiphaga sp.]